MTERLSYLFVVYTVYCIGMSAIKTNKGQLTLRTLKEFMSYLTLYPNHKDLLVNPLNAELNPICHLLALLGGATIVVVSRLRVNIVKEILLR